MSEDHPLIWCGIDLTLELDERQGKVVTGCDAILEWHAGFSDTVRNRAPEECAWE